jgi:hypothetical protein
MRRAGPRPPWQGEHGCRQFDGHPINRRRWDPEWNDDARPAVTICGHTMASQRSLCAGPPIG